MFLNGQPGEVTELGTGNLVNGIKGKLNVHNIADTGSQNDRSGRRYGHGNGYSGHQSLRNGTNQHSCDPLVTDELCNRELGTKTTALGGHGDKFYEHLRLGNRISLSRVHYIRRILLSHILLEAILSDHTSGGI